jgi:hypothetical protein
MKHTHTTQKATMARGGRGMVECLILSTNPWVLFIGKLKTRMPMWAKRKITTNEG